ncbi:unnamed protein product [Dovyalis caffra]|uniref:Uncharacterized protein n=1 Tax=Dovyalis caffra TaxID=77055 RepID=A0AAV1RTR0_9ROSI|nr:unnamed protein product [Dovyalis caffra]
MEVDLYGVCDIRERRLVPMARCGGNGGVRRVEWSLGGGDGGAKMGCKEEADCGGLGGGLREVCEWLFRARRR